MIMQMYCTDRLKKGSVLGKDHLDTVASQNNHELFLEEQAEKEEIKI